MDVLISGAGIAGPTVAYWLAKYGVNPTIVEKSSELRLGGYVVDFWGAGYEIADRMGLQPKLHREGYQVKEVRIVNDRGKRIAGFPASVFSRAAGGRMITIARGDLARSIFSKLDRKTEVIFGDSIRQIEQNAESVRVAFEKADPREFDLVIGADGLHSKVRELVYGPTSQFERYLGYKVAAFTIEGYRPRDELIYVSYSKPGQQVARFALKHDRTLFLFIFSDATHNSDYESDIETQKQTLKRTYENSGWECPRILAALDQVDDLYFDRVSQIRMKFDHGLWSTGRVALIGDAAFCVSLLGGEGASLAMTSAYILAGELYRAGFDHKIAFSRYEERSMPFIQKKQNAAVGFASAFAPKTPFGLFLRNQITKLLRVPWIASIAFGDMTNGIALPSYS